MKERSDRQGAESTARRRTAGARAETSSAETSPAETSRAKTSPAEKKGKLTAVERSKLYLCFEVRIDEIRPVIRRKFLLAKTATFRDLHEAIQDAFGWWNTHEWLFYQSAMKPPIAGPRGREEGFVEPRPDARKVKLASFFVEDGPTKCRYVYDFGDEWGHDVRYAGIVRKTGGLRRELLAGARAGPPEDCGGMYGYEECALLARGKLRANSAERKELKEWLGDWDPERFELEEAKKAFDR